MGRQFLARIDLFLPNYLFFIIEVASRRIVHFTVIAHPADALVAQQLREATPFGPKSALADWDRESK